MEAHADFIVVGAGSAGCALAARLSEDPDLQVTLLEAGGPDRAPAIGIPAAFSTLFKTALDWDFTTEPEPALDGRRLYWPRGRVLGGSSAINAMVWTRGHPADYDRWAELGNPGWAWADLEPYFARVPIPLSQLARPNPITRAFLEAGRAAGLTPVRAADSAHPGGIGLFDLTIRRGRRWSAARAYLRPARRHRNLTVRTGVLVERVLLEGRRAIGVEVRDGPTRRVIAARRGVVLAAGAVGSPHLLLRSGIGPGEELAQVGVPEVHALPGVGRNLLDHLAIGIGHRALRPVTLERARTWRHLVSYLLFRRGPFCSNVAEAGAFLRTRAEAAAPDLELLFAPIEFRNHGLDPVTEPGFTIGVVLLQPRSTGRLRLASADPLAPPRIEPNYLSDDRDREKLVAGIRWAREVAAQEPLAAFRGPEVRPGAGAVSDEALSAFIRRESQTLYHPVGTCRMGTDAGAVVSPRLAVHGLEALWVADASVMPAIPSAHPHAPTLAIAERAADLLRGRG